MRRPQTRSDIEAEEPILTTAEIFESAARRVTNGLVIAGALIGLAIWARPSPTDYQGFASERGVVRLNLESGSMIECVDGSCTQILRPGQRLLRAKATISGDSEDGSDSAEGDAVPAVPAPPAQRQLAPPAPEAPAAPGATTTPGGQATPQPQPATR
jgi:hypothetical protein